MYCLLCLQTQEWPLESFCDELCNDLFNPSWEVRIWATFSKSSSVPSKRQKPRFPLSMTKISRTAVFERTVCLCAGSSRRRHGPQGDTEESGCGRRQAGGLHGRTGRFPTETHNPPLPRVRRCNLLDPSPPRCRGSTRSGWRTWSSGCSASSPWTASETLCPMR